jgi:hypothetical protein
MFTFLNSAILVGLAAIAIPIIIHLFTRQQKKVIDFSSLRFLKEMQKEKIKRLKIRQLLLLLLRALLILLLVLAFARPTMRSESFGSPEAGAQSTVVIILDNTLSMGVKYRGQSLLEHARKRASAVLETVRPGDQVYLIYPQSPAVLVTGEPRYDPESVSELIEQTRQSNSSTSLSDAILAAGELLGKSRNLNKEIYLISDLQASGIGLDAGLPDEPLLPADIKLFVLPVASDNKTNLSITDLKFGNQIVEEGKVIGLTAFVKNTGGSPAKNRLVHLFLNGQRVGQDDVELGAGEITEVSFNFVPQRAGFQQGMVMLEDDDLSEDNRCYFSFFIPESLPVLLVGGNKDDTRFLELALAPSEDTGSYLKISSIARPDLAKTKLGDYGVVILSNYPSFDGEEILRLQEYVRNGGGLFVIPGNGVDLRNYNQYLHEKLDLPELGELSRNVGANEFLSFGNIDYSHPVFDGVFAEEQQVQSPHFKLAINLRADSEKQFDRVIDYSNGSPFLFESKYQQGRILYATSGLESSWSDLAFRGFFVPLVNRCVFYLAGTSTVETKPLYVGDDLVYQPEALSPELSFSVEEPDGEVVKLKPSVRSGGYELRLDHASKSGVYALKDSEDKIVRQWAVNLKSTEMDLRTLDFNSFVERVEHDKVFEIDDEVQIASVVEQTRFGSEFWKIIMAIALAFLLVEMFIYREKSTKGGMAV